MFAYDSKYFKYIIHDNTKKSRIILSVVILAISIYYGIDSILLIKYPPGMDQDGYLLAGKEFSEKFILMWRAPLYSMWMGVVYYICEYDMRLAFYVEKILSIIILSSLIGVMIKRLIGGWAGVVSAAWTWNLKYLLTETNGSHAAAASMFTLAIISLSIVDKYIRILLVFYFLYLSAMCRSEMWVVLILTGMLFIGYWLKRNAGYVSLIAGLKNIPGKYWILTLALLCMSISMNVMRMSKPEQDRLSVAFMQNFVVTYVEREGLKDKYQDAWISWQAVLAEVMPNAATPYNAIKYYPSDIVNHFIYNVRLSIKALPATAFAFNSNIVAAFTFILLILTILSGGFFSQDQYLNSGSLYLVAIVLVSACILVPISIVLRVAARYYIQLIPVMIFISTVLIRYANLFVISAHDLPRDYQDH